MSAPLPSSWAALGAAGVICAAAVWFLVVDPAPDGRAVPATATTASSSTSVADPSGVAHPTRDPDAAVRFPDRGPAQPVPTDRATVPAPTARAEPWYRTGLPVDGTIVPVAVPTGGAVHVTRTGERRIRVTITGFSTAQQDADLRVQLTGGDVVRHGKDAEWVPDGDPVEVGTIPHGSTSTTIDVTVPQILPPAVRSLVVLDWNTTTILGAAELLPSVD